MDSQSSHKLSLSLGRINDVTGIGAVGFFPHSVLIPETGFLNFTFARDLI